MRCFVAIKVGEPVRAMLGRVQEALRRADADVKWTEPENLHLTLKFLGEIDGEQAEGLRKLLEVEAARWPALRLEYAGIGCFPEQGPPKVIWAGCAGDLEKLAGLAAAAERAAEQVGVPRETRPFVAHLTIGRVRSPRNLKWLKAAIENQRRVPLGQEIVAEFALVRSTLTPDGSVYESLAEFPLAKA